MQRRISLSLFHIHSTHTHIFTRKITKTHCQYTIHRYEILSSSLIYNAFLDEVMRNNVYNALNELMQTTSKKREKVNKSEIKRESERVKYIYKTNRMNSTNNESKRNQKRFSHLWIFHTLNRFIPCRLTESKQTVLATRLNSFQFYPIFMLYIHTHQFIYMYRSNIDMKCLLAHGFVKSFYMAVEIWCEILWIESAF